MEWEKLGEEIGILIHVVIGMYLTHRTRNSESLGNKVLVAVFFFTGWVFYWISYVIQDFVKNFVTGLKEGRAKTQKDTPVGKEDKPVDGRILYFKRIYSKHKFFFRLMVVLSSLISSPIGVFYGIDSIKRVSNPDTYMLYLGIFQVTNPQLAFLTTFVITTLPIFISIFFVGQVLYFTVKWVRSGSTRFQFYFRMTAVFSIVSVIIASFVASLDIKRNYEPQYHSYHRKQNIKESISAFIRKYEINLDIDSFVVGAICSVGVWLLYFSILWVYRARDSEAEE